MMFFEIFMIILFIEKNSAILPRIYKGTDCDAKDYPFLAVYATITGVRACAGTILTPKLILTAAHCTFLMDNPNLTMIVIVDPDTKKEASYRLESYVNHPKHKVKGVGGYMIWDLAILVLKKRIKNPTLVQLPQTYQGDIYYEKCKEAMAMGWGLMEGPPDNLTAVRPSKTLRCVNLPILPVKKCVTMGTRVDKGRLYSVKWQIATILCTFSPEEKDACPGDSGGPLMCNGEQIGITSFGPMCGDQDNAPGVWTRTDAVYRFLDTITKQYDPAAITIRNPEKTPHNVTTESFSLYLGPTKLIYVTILLWNTGLV